MEKQEIIKMISGKGIICISGPSAGAGKTSLVEGLTNKKTGVFHRECKKTVTTTTRSRSEKEVYGVDYYFISVEKFIEKEKNGEFIETNHLTHDGEDGDYYGLTFLELRGINRENRTPIHVCDVNGSLYLKEMYGNLVTTIFIYASMEDLEKRIRERGRDNEEVILKRLKIAEKELHNREEFDYVVINHEGNFEQALYDLGHFVQKHLSRF